MRALGLGRSRAGKIVKLRKDYVLTGGLGKDKIRASGMP
jgi:hypothetical protein